MSNNVRGKFVTVGELLGNIEEYVPQDEKSIYEEDGKLYAAVNGTLHIDPLKRTMNIIPATQPKRPIPKVGDYVIAQIDYMRKFTIGVTVFKINRKVLLDTNLSGNVHVSNVSNEYTDKISDVYERGDWIRAKIVKTGTELELTKLMDHAWESLDVTVLFAAMKWKKKGKNNLQCPFCGKKEQRKLRQIMELFNEPFVI
jgi:exosome complex RNA-binding protein Csl4